LSEEKRRFGEEEVGEGHTLRRGCICEGGRTKERGRTHSCGELEGCTYSWRVGALSIDKRAHKKAATAGTFHKEEEQHKKGANPKVQGAHFKARLAHSSRGNLLPYLR
jgi:hypothetical protein